LHEVDHPIVAGLSLFVIGALLDSENRGVVVSLVLTKVKLR